MKRTSRKNKPFWERAYRGHAYWRAKQKLGKVSLLSGRHITPGGKYHWEAAGKAGYSDDLGKAKAAVEFAVLSAEKQLDLFQT